MVHGVAIQIFSIFFWGGCRSQLNPPILPLPRGSPGRWAPPQSLDIRCPCSVDGCDRRSPSRWRMWSECYIDLGIWYGLVWKEHGENGEKFPKIQWFRSNHSFPMILMAFLGINCYFWHMAHPYLQHIFQVFGDERIVSGDPWSNGMPNSNR